MQQSVPACNCSNYDGGFRPIPLVLSALYQDLHQRGGLDIVQALRQGLICFEPRQGGWEIVVPLNLIPPILFILYILFDLILGIMIS
ncbi:MAG: hypothetical protein A2W36_05135 [Chloroflexi bacterium RBG_16_58_14]|nr:MAG: hypothetical protein A2W36_05135 [Chloroflexi bacterium RBG_16_58_14]